MFYRITLAVVLTGCIPAFPEPERAKYDTETGDSVVAGDSDSVETGDSVTGRDSGSDSVPLLCADADGDGYEDVVCGGTDCDDTVATVNPDAVEACNGFDDNCDEFVDNDALDADTWYEDIDGDGYGSTSTVAACAQPDGFSAETGDCNDTNSNAHPGNTEVCDDIDNDCDGSVDVDAVDASTWYLDADSDGWGDEAAVQVACDEPSGYVSVPSDCNDLNGDINPFEVEVCNGVDDNCSGGVDDGLSQSSYYRDVDGDGQGDPLDSVSSCSVPTGYVAILTDCDDTDPSVYAMAAEVCDEVDNDCDGSVDEAGNGPTWFLDADGDGFGNDNESQEGDCVAPDGYVTDNSDCDDTEETAHPGGIEVCDGFDNDCDGSRDGADAADAIAWYEDADGDGYGSGIGVVACAGPAGYASDDGDCDDASDMVYPSAMETCTDGDLNCDGSAGYTDADGDGFVACEECDDSNSNISPAAVEMCNDTDDDCDGSADEDAADALTWYRDSDSDAYGTATSTALACDEPSGYVQDSTDCDDTAASAFPGGTEVCDDGVDEDCDGSDLVCSAGGDTGSVDTGGSDTGGDTGSDTGDPDTGGSGDTDSGDTSSGDSSTDTAGGGDTSGGTDSSSGSGGDSGGDTGTPHGTLIEVTFGDGGTCSADPFTNGAGDPVVSSMVFSDGAGSCGVFVYGGGSSSAPSGTNELLYEATGFTVGVTYTVELDLENTVPTDANVYATFGGGAVSTAVVSGSSSSAVSFSWMATSAAEDLEIWSSAGTSYDVVAYGMVIRY